MKSFLLPVGRYAGTSLPTLLSALSCGASVPVTGLDIFHITDRQPDPVLVPMIRDLNQAHKLFKRADNRSFFPSSFSYASYQPELPSISVLSSDPASASLLAALRGKGVPLSYKTDREAVEWAFSAFLSSFGENGDEDPFRRFLDNIQNCISAGEEYRVAVLCDLNDPFSSGAAFALLRFLHESINIDSSVLSLFCLSVNVSADAAQAKELLSSSLRALASQNLVGKPDHSVPACADAVWLLSLPSSMVRSEDSLRIVYAVLAVHLARFFTAPAAPSPGLHTVTIPGVLTFQSLGDQAGSFAAFLHAAAWLLSDLIPAFVSWCDHPGALRSLAPNSRNGLFRRLMQGEMASPEQREVVAVIQRAFSAVLSEVIALIHFLPDQLRLAEVSDPLWRKAVEACGKTVTVASEYDVSKQEAEESGIMDVMPVHRVSMADTEEEKARKRLDEIAEQLKAETEARDKVFSSVGGCWALPALLDCRRRCQEALERVSAQLENMTPGQDHLSVASLSRRVRLLQAAVSRCDEDLDAVSFAGSGSASGLEGLTPFSSQLLNAPAAEKLSALLNASGNSTDAIRKDLLAQLPSLLFGCSLSDVKTLFRQLLSCCKQESGIDPFASLCLYTLDVSIRELSALRFLSAGDVPSIPLLPDLYPSAPLLQVSSLLPLLEES
ncbi:MAG: hypothetical protein J6Y48_05060 [Clostridia bacterium]|nr:hypothetical protein [Clostridia bacterium]